jgi:MFS family permease
MSAPLRTRWGVIMFIVACGMVGAAQVFKFAPAMPTIRRELGLGLVAGGWVFSIVNLIAMLMGFVAGTLSDIFGHRRTLMIGLLALGLGSMAGSFAESGAVMLLSRVIEGIGFLAVVVAAPGLIAAEATVRDRHLAFSLWGVYHPAGVALMLVSAPFILEALGWRVVWQGISGLSFLFAALVLVYRPQLSDRSLSEGAAFGRVVQNLKLTLAAPGPRLLALTFAFYAFSFISVVAWLPTFMIEHRGFSAVLAGSLTALVIIANAVGNLAAGIFLHRGLRYYLPILVTAGMMALAALVIFSGTLPDGLRYGACLIYSLFGGMVPTTVFAAGPVMAPSRTQLGAVNGMIVQGANFGSVFGPPAVAAVVAWSGAWEPARWPILAALGLVAVMGLFIRRIELRSET